MKAYKKYLLKNERKALALFVSEIRTALGENLVDIRIFGSKVRGDCHEESDIDILLIVKHRDSHVRERISEITSDLNLEFDCLLSPVVYTEREYSMNVYFKNLFAENILNEAIAL